MLPIETSQIKWQCKAVGNINTNKFFNDKQQQPDQKIKKTESKSSETHKLLITILVIVIVILLLVFIGLFMYHKSS